MALQDCPERVVDTVMTIIEDGADIQFVGGQGQGDEGSQLEVS
jgi:hypothetical protein